MKRLSLMSMLLGGIAVLCLTSAFSSGNKSISRQEPKLADNISDIDYEVGPGFDLEAEDVKQLETEQMTVSLNSSSVTEDSQAYSVTFASNVVIYGTRFGNLEFMVTDPAFDLNNLPSIEDETQLPHFEATVSKITVGRNNRYKDVVIPRTVTRAERFVMDIKSISTEVIDPQFGWQYVQSVSIPTTIETIFEDSMLGVPDSVTIKVQGEEKPSGWAETWTDAKNIEYNYDYESASALEKDAKVSRFGDESSGYNFMIGSFGEGDNYQPMKVQYEVTKADGSKELRHKDLDLVSSNSNYDGVGKEVGKGSFARTVDLYLAPGEVVDDESIWFYNIHEAKKNPDGVGYSPVLDTNYVINARIAYSMKTNVKDFIDYEYKASSTFAGYTSVSIKLDLVDGIYPKLAGSIYETNKADIEAGKKYIRYRFISLYSTSYDVLYESAEGLKRVEVRTNTPVEYYNIPKTKDNTITFMFKNTDVGPDFTLDKLRGFDVIGLYISIDIFNNELHDRVIRSAVDNRFGNLEIIADNDVGPMNMSNVNIEMIVIVVIYTVVFLIASVSYFFYKKVAYKNDEFRRLKPKSFLKNAGISYVLTGTILLSIISIFFRATKMNDSVVVYNPLDVLIIVFSILAILAIGYYVKFFVGAFKSMRERAKAKKLRLDEDTADDGTN